MKPFVLGIGGFDPSSGAGITADIKTFENCSVYGLGAVTAVTFQNENNFSGLKWITQDDITNQLNSVIFYYPLEFVKIGIVESLNVLDNIINHLLSVDNNIKIIWDPVIKSSTGFIFQSDFKENKLFDILRKIFLVVPNVSEFETLFDKINVTSKNIHETIIRENLCSVLIKSGHTDPYNHNDLLYQKEGLTVIHGRRLDGFEKHGSGCVYASAITSYLALGNNLTAACIFAKDYINNFLTSSDSKLGFHFNA